MRRNEMKRGLRWILVTAATGMVTLVTAATVVHAQSINVGSTSGSPGTSASFDVTLDGSTDVVAITNDMGFDPATPPAAVGGAPDCTLNPAITKENTSFAFLPRDCELGSTCEILRATVLSFNPATADVVIPNGVVYTCNYAIPADAAIGSTIDIENLSSTITVGRDDIDVSEASSGGSVSVVPMPTATSTPEVPTATSTPTRTNTPVPTNTTAPTNTRVSGGGDDDDGCQVVAPANSGAGWLLLIPAAALLWQRRRSR